jgi:hypothetical protein
MEHAMEEYEVDNKTPFRFAACIPVLYIVTNIDPMLATINDDNQIEQPSIMGCSLQRPMGNKAAKLMKKTEDTKTHNLSESKSLFQKMLDSTVQKEAFEELVVLWKYFKSIGNTEKMLATTASLENLANKNLKAREEHVTIDSTKTTNVVSDVIILTSDDRISAATDDSGLVSDGNESVIDTVHA